MSNRELITLVVVVLVIGSGFNFAFTWMGKANQAYNGRIDQQMTECQTAGYTYGECFNVVNQRTTYKFAR